MPFTGIYNSWRWRGMATYPFLTSTYTRDQMTPWAIRSTENQPTNLYLNNSSNLQALLSTLVHTARAPCDKESLHEKMEFPKTMFKENGYNMTQIWHVNSSVRTSKLKQKPTSFTVLPYVQMTYSQLNRMFAKHNIRCIGLPPRKISSLPPPGGGGPGTEDFRVYSIPWKCGQVYIGRTGRSIQQNKRTPPAHTAWTSRQINGGRM